MFSISVLWDCMVRYSIGRYFLSIIFISLVIIHTCTEHMQHFNSITTSYSWKMVMRGIGEKRYSSLCGAAASSHVDNLVHVECFVFGKKNVRAYFFGSHTY